MVPANQGSRTGIVVWMVFTSILSLVAVILAIYFYAQGNDAILRLEGLQKKYNEVIPEAQLTSADVTDLNAFKEDADLGFNGSMKSFDILMKQRDDLVARLGGSGYREAISKADALLVPPKTAGTTQPLSGSVTALVESLNQQSRGQSNQIAQLTSQLDDANSKLKATSQEVAAARAKFDEELAAVKEEANKALAGTTAYTQSKDATVEQLQADFAKKQTDTQEAQQTLTNQIADLNKQLEQSKLQYQNLQQKLGATRVNTADATVRAADGTILRVVSRDVVYIDLGQGDQVAPGLTFQVFDRVEGVPPVGENSGEENLPRGKASIEVVRVGAGSSECRVIRFQPGQNIIEGDLIANLVYDRNAKYSFTVYGNFDLDQNNVATPGDTEVVKRLVSQWGATPSEKITVDTDFLVIGAEPEVPSFTREELEDPINSARYAEAVAALEAYQDILRQARDLNVPILNQNRFLYYIGYFESAKR